MAAHLLDVNVLVALLWPPHEGHGRAQSWFAQNLKAGWATCPFTQAGCVRILSNPAFSKHAVTPRQALKLLNENLSHPSHSFWPDDLTFADAAALLQQQLEGHRQITDAYLLGLAMHRKAKLVTLDRSLSALLSKDKKGVVVVL
jgi:toxin-antitoxin system PIN domain toxin